MYYATKSWPGCGVDVATVYPLCGKYAPCVANIFLTLVNVLNFVRRTDMLLQCGIDIADVMPLLKFWAFPPLDLGRPVYSGGPFFLSAAVIKPAIAIQRLRGAR
jgi:hypothetical protein